MSVSSNKKSGCLAYVYAILILPVKGKFCGQIGVDHLHFADKNGLNIIHIVSSNIIHICASNHHIFAPNVIDCEFTIVLNLQPV